MSMIQPSQSPPIEVFWGEMAPCEHMVQFYQDEGLFLDTLLGFVGSGLCAGETVVVIATAAHRDSLEARLEQTGMAPAKARAEGRYIALDAADTLARFMVDGWPEEERFRAVIGEVISAAAGEGRKVRAFGEMVALLWTQGHHGATVRLEHLWNDFCIDHQLALFCAYPRIGATRDISESVAEVCAVHSRVVPA